MPRGVRLAPGANLLEPPDLPSASRFVQGKDTAARKIAFFIALLGALDLLKRKAEAEQQVNP